MLKELCFSSDEKIEASSLPSVQAGSDDTMKTIRIIGLTIKGIGMI